MQTRERNLLLSQKLPVDPVEERMRLQRIEGADGCSIFRRRVQKTGDKVLQVGVKAMGELNALVHNVIKNRVVVLSVEGRKTLTHLVDNAAEGPEVCVKARLAAVEHLGRNVEGRPNERAVSLAALPENWYVAEVC